MVYNFSQVKSEGERIKEKFKKEIASIRTGRSNPSLVENLMVDSYGAKTSLKHLASISAEDARTLRITPWDASLVKKIEHAVATSDLGIQPTADKQSVRASVPALTEERRKSLIKILSSKLEEVRIFLRLGRDKSWKDIQEKEKEGKISEDDKFRFKDELQKIIDDISKELEKMAKNKEKEIIS